MFLADKTCTVYNKYDDGIGTHWTRTVIDGVSWFKNIESAITDSGRRTAEVYKIRIPVTARVEEEKVFVEPLEFQKTESKDAIWTIQNNDKIVLGVAEIPPDDEDLIDRLEETYQDTATVTAWTDNRRGIPEGQHLRIEGV